MRRIILSITLLYIILKEAESKVTKSVKVHVIEPCKDHPKNAIMNINNVQLKDTISGTHMYFEANITEDWPKGMVFNIQSKRCKSKENLDTCETWSPINTTKACGMIYMKNQPWSKLTEDIRPPFVCPMKKNYYIINGTLQFGNSVFLLPLPINQDTWRIEFRLIVKNVIRCAMSFIVQIISYNRA